MPKKPGHPGRSEQTAGKDHGRKSEPPSMQHHEQKSDHRPEANKANRHPQKDQGDGLGGGAKIALPKKGCLPTVLMLLIPFSIVGVTLLLRS